MRHTPLTLSHISALIALARETGEGVMNIYRQTSSADDSPSCSITVSHKTDDSPLTIADLLAHRLIAEGLKRITPHIPVVSEEDVGSMSLRTPDGRFWLIDPLDGTKEFILRNGEFTINIALIENGRSAFGIVLAPCLDLLFWGAPNMGAFREVKGSMQSIELTNSCGRQRQPVRVIASRNHLDADTSRFIDCLGTYELIQAGSSLKFCRVAEGLADIYPRLSPTCEWDTAAAQAILEAAGGRVLTLDGKSLRYGKPSAINPYFIATGSDFQYEAIARDFMVLADKK